MLLLHIEEEGKTLSGRLVTAALIKHRTETEAEIIFVAVKVDQAAQAALVLDDQVANVQAEDEILFARVIDELRTVQALAFAATATAVAVHVHGNLPGNDEKHGSGLLTS